MHPENRPYLRALYAAILANVHLQRHQDAVMLTDKILAYNPEDNQALRWLLGSELLRTGDHERAFSVLKNMLMNFHLTGMNLVFCIFLMGNW